MSDHNLTNQQSELARVRGKRLKSLRNLAGLSRKALNEKYRVSDGTLRGWEEGRFGGLTEQGAEKMLAIYQQEGIQCSLSWLLHGNGIGPQVLSKVSSIIGETTGSYQSNRTTADAEQAILQELSLFRQLHPKTLDMIVHDDAMEPYFGIGDIVAGEAHPIEQIDDLMGYICIIETVRGDLYLRRLRQGSKSGLYNLWCLNLNSNLLQPILYDVEIRSIAVVVWHRRKPVNFNS